MTSATAARFNINRTIQSLAELGSVLDYLLDRFQQRGAVGLADPVLSRTRAPS